MKVDVGPGATRAGIEGDAGSHAWDDDNSSLVSRDRRATRTEAEDVATSLLSPAAGGDTPSAFEVIVLANMTSNGADAEGEYAAPAIGARSAGELSPGDPEGEMTDLRFTRLNRFRYDPPVTADGEDADGSLRE
jgi:hypothetical protein